MFKLTQKRIPNNIALTKGKQKLYLVFTIAQIFWKCQRKKRNGVNRGLEDSNFRLPMKTYLPRGKKAWFPPAVEMSPYYPIEKCVVSWLLSFLFNRQKRSERLRGRRGRLLPPLPLSWDLHRSHEGHCFLSYQHRLLHQHFLLWAERNTNRGKRLFGCRSGGIRCIISLATLEV